LSVETYDGNRRFESPMGGLTQIATVEVSSEDPQFPLESAFTGRGPDWQAGKMGEQRIR
jgi:hypothetical protein